MVKLWYIIDPLLDICDRFAELFFKAISSMNLDQQVLFGMLLWSIWKRRNERLWEHKTNLPRLVVDRSKYYLHEWNFFNKDCEQNGGVMRHTPVASNRYTTPNMGCVKVNIDAAFNCSIGKVGFGWCVWTIKAFPL